jgi:hypothetical protein
MEEEASDEEGYYWYRDEDREVVLHVFESLTPGYWHAWDWQVDGSTGTDHGLSW